MSLTDEHEFFTLCRHIWCNLSEAELKEIKTYLRWNNRKSFGSAVLEKIKDGIDLVEELKRRDLLRPDKMEFLKNMLDQIHRTDLLTHIRDYEVRMSQGVNRSNSDMTSCKRLFVQTHGPTGITDIEKDAPPTIVDGTINVSDPISHVSQILIIAAEEDKNKMTVFHDDVKESSTFCPSLTSEEIVVEKAITKEFLKSCDKKIVDAKLVFMLFSNAFVNDCYADICKLKNFHSVLCNKDNYPLIVPVALEKRIIFPIGLKAKDKLNFHTRNSYYKESLSKLIAQSNM